MKASEAEGGGQARRGGGQGQGQGQGWLGGLLLFLVALILIGGFAYPMLQRRSRPPAPGSDDVHDVILGRLDRIEQDLRQLDRIEGRLTLLEERQRKR